MTWKLCMTFLWLLGGMLAFPAMAWTAAFVDRALARLEYDLWRWLLRRTWRPIPQRWWTGVGR